MVASVRLKGCFCTYPHFSLAASLAQMERGGYWPRRFATGSADLYPVAADRRDIPWPERFVGHGIEICLRQQTATAGAWLLLALVSYLSAVKLRISPDYLPMANQAW